jgi:hypothetical protein
VTLLGFTIQTTNTRNMEYINWKVYDLYTRGVGSYLGRDTGSPATGFVFLSPSKQILLWTSNQAMTANSTNCSPDY